MDIKSAFLNGYLKDEVYGAILISLDMRMLIMLDSWLMEKAHQVWLIFLDPVWSLGQPRHNTSLPCPQQKPNM